ncbi:MAG: hypothetical protein AB7I42_25970 [Bradyrhizobium sp.]|uniref:hypothetical protein n=1 Tax=Bradyrhizobium sp. TaxID=376 RepID=UPI003D0B76A8
MESRTLILDGMYAKQRQLRHAAAHRLFQFLSRINMTQPPTMLTSTVQDPKTWQPRPKIGPSCWMPHQGAKECARRAGKVSRRADWPPLAPWPPPVQRGGKRRSA